MTSELPVDITSPYRPCGWIPLSRFVRLSERWAGVPSSRNTIQRVAYDLFNLAKRPIPLAAEDGSNNSSSSMIASRYDH